MTPSEARNAVSLYSDARGQGQIYMLLTSCDDKYDKVRHH